MNVDRLKFYVLISGQLTFDLSFTKSQFINVCENLDWKRQFALHLWFNCLPIHSINDALNAYERSVSDRICNRPVPPYIEDSVASSSSNNDLDFTDSNTSTAFKSNLNATTSNLKPNLAQTPQNSHQVLFDTCYHLIKLYCDNNHPIEGIIAPLNHSSNQLDFRLRFENFENILSDKIRTLIWRPF